MSLPFPEIDPVAIQLGPLPIRWYSLAYIGGLALGWYYAVRLLRAHGLWPAAAAAAAGPTREARGLAGKAKGAAPISPVASGAPLTRVQLDDLIFWVAAGVMLGGRLGYIFFYEPSILVQPWVGLGAGMNPGLLKTLFGWIYLPPALMLWNGGMSFHGGLLGVTIAGLWFANKHGLSALQIGDLFSAATPIGLFFGRLANFINGELYGRPTDGPMAMRFPLRDSSGAISGWTEPRHPSQLYEAALEGILLFTVLTIAVWRFKLLRRPGAVMGLFLLGYGLSRVAVENFREPDAFMPNFPLGLTMGMLLSAPMIALGAYFLHRAFRRTAGIEATAAASASKPQAPAA
jgi:phosphatidylglycerol:prolipoprotein diacylglycerol transferase